MKNAKDPLEKHEIIFKLYLAWLKCPELRLGQLIQNTFKGDIFYIDDYKFIKCIEEFVDIKVESLDVDLKENK